MTIDKFVTIEGKEYPVLISDEYEALQAALAAGRAVVELIGGGPMSNALFAVEDAEDADDLFLDQVVRRNLGLPWVIAQTERLVIREFCAEDAGKVPVEPGESEDDRVFHSEDLLRAYIENQYGFYQYGIWALEERESGRLIGKAGVVSSGKDGVDGLELGYHVFQGYRRMGYAKEACRAVLEYVDHRMPGKVYAKIAPDNQASISLAESLGFRFVTQRYNEEGRCHYRYVRN